MSSTPGRIDVSRKLPSWGEYWRTIGTNYGTVLFVDLVDDFIRRYRKPEDKLANGLLIAELGDMFLVQRGP